MRFNLALLVDHVFDSFQEQLWYGVRDAAEARDANLFCFEGGAFAPRSGQAAEGGAGRGNHLYDLLPRAGMDGLVLVTAVLGFHVNDEELQERVSALGPVPMIGLGRPVPGVPTLLLDNRRAAREAVVHLVEHHGCRRIVFLGGPRGSESDDRLEGYRDALAAFGLPFDPALVAAGDFSRASGAAATRALLDRGVQFDAVAAANDYMALQAMKELQAQGLRIPEDVRVTGFDDVPDAAAATPALTTVSQSLRELGTTSVELLLRRLEGEGLPERIVVPGRLVTRRSCGCGGLPPAPEGTSRGRATSPPGSPRAAVAQALEAAHPWLAGRSGRGPRADQLAGALLASIDGEPAATVAPGALLAELMARDLATGRPASPWFAALRAAHEVARRVLPIPSASAVDAQWVEALLVAGEVAEAAHAAARARGATEAGAPPPVFFPTEITEDEIRGALVEQLPRLGVQSFYLSRYACQDRTRAVLFASFGDARKLLLDAPVGPFDAGRLVPGRFSPDQRHAYAVLPVDSRDEHLGFALVELGDVSGAAYGALVNQISTAVRVSTLLDAVRSYSVELERKVEERTRELAATQRRLLDAARRAGMAEIAVGALHNIGNLFNSVNVSATVISARDGVAELEGLRRVAALLEGHRGDLAGYFATDARAAFIPEYLGRLVERLAATQDAIGAESASLQGRLALIRETILGLQSYAREGDDLLPHERIDLAELVEVALQVQAGDLAGHAIRVQRALGALPEVVSQRSKILHVLVNVVKNAAEAMRNVPEARRLLTIAGRIEARDRVVLTLRDEGEGISAEHLPRVFAYGFTTKAAGNGFGLHACANIMRQLRGEIRVESDGLDRGARVTLCFPRE
jgi:DNA-binding LacI/PurR family transcriptional regulator/signal transduction histidine kinase